MAYYSQKYIRMIKAGHPKEIVFQMLCVDFQCTKENDLAKQIIPWIDQISLGVTNVAVPPQFAELAKTKYQRMSSRGVTSEALTYVKILDDYIENRKDNDGSIFEIPPETKTVGELINDRVINDKMVDASSKSEKRATELKKEAISIRSGFVKSSVEKSTDENDTAPLTTVSSRVESTTDKEFHLLSCSFPEPFVTRQSSMEITGISRLVVHPCTFREHVPERMFSYLNVLTPAECRHLIQKLDFTEQEQKIQQNLINAVTSNNTIIRTNIRRNFIDEDVASLVWRVVKSTLPAELSDGRKLAGIRTKMNYYRYGEGQYFKTHLDGGHRFIATGETSEYTFVIYLNDDFTGGTTRFCALPEWNNEVREVKPVKGGMLVFRQSDMKHCGVTLEKGFKHILQGMVMYGPLKHNRFGKPFGKPPQIFITTTCDCE
jgi:hypothetical protein